LTVTRQWWMEERHPPYGRVDNAELVHRGARCGKAESRRRTRLCVWKAGVSRLRFRWQRWWMEERHPPYGRVDNAKLVHRGGPLWRGHKVGAHAWGLVFGRLACHACVSVGGGGGWKSAIHPTVGWTTRSLSTEAAAAARPGKSRTRARGCSLDQPCCTGSDAGESASDLHGHPGATLGLWDGIGPRALAPSALADVRSRAR